MTVVKGRPVPALRLVVRAAPALAATPAPPPPPPAAIAAEMPMASPVTAGRVGGALGGQIAHDQMSYRLQQKSADFNTEAYDGSTRNDSVASPTIRCRRSRSTSTPRRTRTSAASSTSGTLPPPDAVRIEELINYFRFDYPESDRTDAPFSVTTEVAACPWNPRHRLALDRPAGAAARRPSARRRAISCSCSTSRAR